MLIPKKREQIYRAYLIERTRTSGDFFLIRRGHESKMTGIDTPVGGKGMKFQRGLLILILLVGIGCAHQPSGSAGQGPVPARGSNGKEGRSEVQKEKEKPTTTWDDVIEGLGFLLRWIPEDTIIFPFGP